MTKQEETKVEKKDAKVDLDALLKAKSNEYAVIKTEIGKLEQQIQQITQQAQKQKDVLLTKGIEVQGMIKLLKGELGVKEPELPKVEVKETPKPEEVKKSENSSNEKRPVKLEEAKK